MSFENEQKRYDICWKAAGAVPNPASQPHVGQWWSSKTDFFSDISADVLPREWPAVIKYTGHWAIH